MMNVTTGSVLDRSTKNSSVSSKNMSLISSIISQMIGSELTGSNWMRAVSGTKSKPPIIAENNVNFTKVAGEEVMLTQSRSLSQTQQYVNFSIQKCFHQVHTHHDSLWVLSFIEHVLALFECNGERLHSI